MEMVFPSEMVIGETPSGASARTKEKEVPSKRTEQHTTLASICTVIRLILRAKKWKRKSRLEKKAQRQGWSLAVPG
jgi:hypothetical protein